MDDFFYVLSFDSTSHAIQTEIRIKDYFRIATIPTPREITNSCGLSIKIFSLDFKAIKEFLQSMKVPYGFYRLSNQKVDGKREIEKIDLGIENE
ncbi:MAG: DUF3343 domain-containing protein [Eubacteriales bacterium]